MRRSPGGEDASTGGGASARALAERGEAQRVRGDFPAAIHLLTQALALSPDDGWTLMRRGAARGAIHDAPGALEDLGRARSAYAGEGQGTRRQWILMQLGETLRTSLRDLALEPGMGEVECARWLSSLESARAAFTEGLSEVPDNAWAHAHRGAVSMLAYWLAFRMELEPARVAAYSEEAQQDLETAVRLRPDYGWAHVFQAFLWTLRGSHATEEAAWRAHYQQAIRCIQQVRRVDTEGRLVTLRPLAELALYLHDYDAVAEHGWPQLAKEPEDIITRYCVAEALVLSSRAGGEQAPTAASTAEAVLEQTRKALLAKRTRACAMLAGVELLRGRFDEAATLLRQVGEYPDMDTLAFVRRDPVWDDIREGRARREPRLRVVAEAYDTLFQPLKREQG